MAVAFLLMCLLDVGLVLCCTELPREDQSIASRADSADMIAYAQAIQKYPPDSKLYTGEFHLLCPLKQKQKLVEAVENISFTLGHPDLKQLFNVSQLGFAPGFCLQVDVEEGQFYFMFLTFHEDSSNASYVFLPDSVNDQSPFLSDTKQSRDNLKKFTADCNFSAVIAPRLLRTEMPVYDVMRTSAEVNVIPTGTVRTNATSSSAEKSLEKKEVRHSFFEKQVEEVETTTPGVMRTSAEVNVIPTSTVRTNDTSSCAEKSLEKKEVRHSYYEKQVEEVETTTPGGGTTLPTPHSIVNVWLSFMIAVLLL